MCVFVRQVKRRQGEAAAKEGSEVKEMVTPQLQKALEKQGYRIIGSHSGVKLCRWTKVSRSEGSGPWSLWCLV